MLIFLKMRMVVFLKTTKMLLRLFRHTFLHLIALTLNLTKTLEVKKIHLQMKKGRDIIFLWEKHFAQPVILSR